MIVTKMILAMLNNQFCDDKKVDCNYIDVDHNDSTDEKIGR